MMKKTVIFFLIVAGTILSAPGCNRGLGLKECIPAGGVMAGGETVAVVGHGFTPGSSVIVYFGSARAPRAYIEGSTKIVVTTPVYPESTLVDVRVVTEDGKEVALTKAFMFLKSGKWSPLDAFGKKNP